MLSKQEIDLFNLVKKAVCTDVFIAEIENLLKNGLSANIRDEYGRTPLFYVESAKICELLLANGANVNVVDKDGRTPLHGYFTRDREAEVCRILVKSGADINAKSTSGTVPIDDAKSDEMSSLLLKYGAR